MEKLTKIDLNQGRVYQISSWGLQTKSTWLGGITNFHWLSDNKNRFEENYGWEDDDDIDHCSVFTIDSDDYINGYNVRYGENQYSPYIVGITFYTNKGRILSCISNSVPLNLQSSGDIIYSNRYLTGFYVRTGSIIDTIAFQFTAINNTNKCHENGISSNQSIIKTTISPIYGVTITIKFDYTPQNDTNLTTSQIQDILTNITTNIISNSIPLDICIKRDEYNIIITETTNGTIIYAEITTCDIKTEEILVESLNNNNLQNEFLNKTMPYLIMDPLTIKLDVATILEPSASDTEFESTQFIVSQTIAITKGDKNSDKLMEIIIISICISLVIIVCIIIIFCIIKFRRKSDMDENIAVRTQIKSVSHTPTSAKSTDVEQDALRNIPPIIHDFGPKSTAGDEYNHTDRYVTDNMNDVMTPRSEIALAMVKMTIEDNEAHEGNGDGEEDDVYIDNPGTNDINDDNYETRK